MDELVSNPTYILKVISTMYTSTCLPSLLFKTSMEKINKLNNYIKNRTIKMTRLLVLSSQACRPTLTKYIYNISHNHAAFPTVPIVKNSCNMLFFPITITHNVFVCLFFYIESIHLFRCISVLHPPTQGRHIAKRHLTGTPHPLMG